MLSGNIVKSSKRMGKEMTWNGCLEPEILTGKRLIFSEKDKAKEALNTLSDAGFTAY